MTARGLQVHLLGPVSIVRDGVAMRLPPSRKVLALLGYLALEASPQSRSRLCDLLWNAPNDPRGELRWCLSKLRRLLDDPGRGRVVTFGSATIALDLSDTLVDTAEIERALKHGTGEATTERLAELCELFRGDLLEGIEVDGSPELTTWLMAHRQRFRLMRVDLAAQLAARASPAPEETWRRLHTWIQLAPFDRRAHEAMLNALASAERFRDAEEHLAAAIRTFEHEGLDWLPLRAWWHALRTKATRELAPRPDEPRRALVPVDAVTARAGSVELRDAEPPSVHRAVRRRASVAVMPFVEASSSASPPSQLALGLTDDIITRLAKLRVLFVIARGTSYVLGERGMEAQEAGRILGVEYVVSGRLRTEGARRSVLVELAETREARIIWTDELLCDGEATFVVLDAIVNRIVASVAEEIETAECSRAMLKPPCSLDAWEAYHRGLWHMYKFTGPDNREAAQFFRSALGLDPTFSRAHAGLSFTHFQNVFLELTPDRERQIQLALTTAAESLAADERDPAAHWASGRALWLRGAVAEAVDELQRSIELSPNFALGHYTRGFIEAQSGDPRLAIEALNTSRELSPFDPLQFGMLASRALAHVRLGELDEAVSWAMRAVGRPNAHAHILAIAASALSLVDRHDEARVLVGRIRQQVASYDVERLLRAFHFDRDTETLVRQSARHWDR